MHYSTIIDYRKVSTIIDKNLRNLIFKVLTASNLINSAPLEESARGGFPDYKYPRWSTILGWFIFVGCIIPIPTVFLVRYIQQYRRIAAQRLVILLSLLDFFREKKSSFSYKEIPSIQTNFHPHRFI